MSNSSSRPDLPVAASGNAAPDISLRPLVLGDAEVLFALVDRNRQQLSKFWWEEHTRSPADSRDFIGAVNDAEQSNGAPTRGILVNGRLVGVAALHTIDLEKGSSLAGYWIDNRESGKGYVTAAVRLLLHQAFHELDLREVRITPRATNMASRAIAQKLGFELVGIGSEPAWRTDEHVETATYALARDAYLTAHSSQTPIN
jgi:ribosomal-protein-serine acetyltransferase